MFTSKLTGAQVNSMNRSPDMWEVATSQLSCQRHVSCWRAEDRISSFPEDQQELLSSYVIGQRCHPALKRIRTVWDRFIQVSFVNLKVSPNEQRTVLWPILVFCYCIVLFNQTALISHSIIISAEWTKWMAEVMFSSDCVSVCVCAANRSIWQLGC